MEIKNVKLTQLHINTGQIDGVPRNPRKIDKKQLERLKKSIEDNPEMLALREVIAYDNGGELVVLCGNMRLRALRELGYKQTPVKIVPQDTDAKSLRAYVVKDNVSFGADDFGALAQEWDATELKDFGFDVPDMGEVFFNRNEDEDNDDYEDEDEEYKAFVDKFKVKKNSDDCYTPTNIYNAVKNWVCKEYGVDETDIVRPFYPGGDYINEDYKEGCVVLDNPPFSILTEIKKFYIERNIKFFLFAPSLTVFNTNGSSSSSSSSIVCNVNVLYTNGANINTSFVTNLDKENVIRVVPELIDAIEVQNKINKEKDTKVLTQYKHPANLLNIQKMLMISTYKVPFVYPVNKIKFVRKYGKAKVKLFGGGFWVSDKGADYLAQAQAQAQAQKRTARATDLTETEKEIIKQLNKLD